MAKNLVIVESPAKAKTIGKYLGRDYQVKASVGHIMDLPKSKLGVDVDNGFAAEYHVIPGKSKATIFVGPLKAGEYTFVGEFNEKTAKGVIVAR